ATAPKITSILVNDGAAQRSRVTSLKVNFDQVVTLPATPTDAFHLERQSDGKLPALSAAVDNSGPATVVTLTFTGNKAVEFGSLAAGRYSLSVYASSVTSAGGQLDGNGDGTGGDDYVLIGDPASAPKLFRFFGDNDGDGDADAVDFLQFRNTFGLGSA